LCYSRVNFIAKIRMIMSLRTPQPTLRRSHACGGEVDHEPWVMVSGP